MTIIKRFHFTIDIPMMFGLSMAVNKGGYYDVDTIHEKGKKIRDFVMTSYFCYQEYVSSSEVLPSDLEVVYVGQAFGRKENRTIDYRISNHEKVQEIALDILDSGSNE
jgi:hypothetical protein